MGETGQPSVFAALYEWERKNGGGGGGGGKPKTELPKSGKLRLGGQRQGVRKFHPGHRLSGQRINNIVKVKFVPNNKDARRHIMAHLDYIQNRERELNEPERKFYGRDGERSKDDVVKSLMQNRGDDAAMFKIILSPKQNELNLHQYVTEIMQRFEEKTGIVTDWSLNEHRNTEYHHVHIVMPGRDMDGNSYRLEKEHLDILRELANEYQYELQDLVYEREKQIEYEFGYTRDEANMLLEAGRDKREMKELGIYNPEIDKNVQEELLKPTNWDNVYFRGQLEKELMQNVADDFKELQSELQEAMIATHPELYQGLIRQLQTQEINNEYFQQLKNFHPLEYERYLKDPSLNRNEVVDRLKQAFPQWFDPIVEFLKEQKPELFSNYQKPAPTDRQIMDNLTKTKPELFPELSKQIQDNQKNLFAMAYLAHNKPELFNKINEVADVNKQIQMLADAKKQFPEVMKEAELALAAQQPDIYKHGEKTPTQADIIIDLAKTNPSVFPETATQLQKMEIDNVLFDKFREEHPDAPEKFQTDPNLRGIIINLLRSNRPELLEEATAKVRHLQPELFAFERNEPTQNQILEALMKDEPELFPQAMKTMKNQEIDKAYFDRAKEVMPDGLQRYIDDPNLDRSELHKVLRNTFPDWRSDIESELKEKMPQLFQYDSPTSNQQILDELQKTHPELFPGLEQEDKEPPEKDPLSAKLDKVKERLVNEAYFERGRDKLSDGLQAYLANSEYDRQYIIQGLRETFPEWLKDIENHLKELHPLLFLTPEKVQQPEQTKQQQKEALDKLRHGQDHTHSDSRETVQHEAMLLLALSSGIEKLEQQIDDQDKQEIDPAKDAEMQEKQEHAQQDADKFQIGHGWAGLTGIHHGAFIGEHIDLSEEAKALFEDQKELAQQIDEANQHAEVIDPKVFQIEDIVKSVEERLEEHEKQKEPDERA